MDDDTLTSRYAERINAAQFGLLLRNYQRQFPVLAIIAPTVVAAMWDRLPHGLLLLWGGVYLLSVIERRWFTSRYLRREHSVAETRRWIMPFALRTAVGGMLIGSCGVWMYVPESIPHQAFLFAFLFVTSAGAPVFYARILPVYFAYLPWVMLPLAFRMLLPGSESSIWGAVAVIIYTAVLLQAGRDYAAATWRNFALSFENVDLVGELTVKKEEAESANRAKSRFLAAASHDLRQPLQALSLLTGTLKLRSAPGPERELVERIGQSVDTLDGLFNALLDISKLDSAVIRPERAPLDLDALFARIERDAAPTAEAKGLRLRTRPSGLWVDSDEVLLRRILQNLVSNAVRYTSHGTVWLGARRRRGKVRMEVRDSGAGIGAEHLGRIFEEFYQVANPERDRRKGLGLGLAIVRRLADLLGHELDVRTEPGRGSVFAVSAPRAEAPAAAGTAGAAADAAADLRGMRVLFIEDDADVREALLLALREWGCDVVAAAQAAEALAALESRAPWRPQVLLSDYHMPGGGDGVEAARRIVAHLGASVPVTLISGDTAESAAQAAAAAGYGLLHKPVSAERLHALLRKLRGEAAPWP